LLINMQYDKIQKAMSLIMLHYKHYKLYRVAYVKKRKANKGDLLTESRFYVPLDTK